MKNVLVLGGGGFIGGHLVKRLVSQGHWVRSVDTKLHPYGANPSEFVLGDLSEAGFCEAVLRDNMGKMFDEVYQLAADMGGAGYIFTGENDANVMSNSASINLNLLKSIVKMRSESLTTSPQVFFSSSACIYPEDKQVSVNNTGLKEEYAYPANPDSDYGWEKLFSERLFLAFGRNYGLNIRIARFHNIFGPEGTWNGGKEKAPAAICRKVAMAENGDTIEVWGDGNQTRSFLYIDDCLIAVEKLMRSSYSYPINIGSEESISINGLVKLAASFENKEIKIKHIKGPQGVRGRNSDNELMRKVLNWDYSHKLKHGLEKTYFWILDQLHKSGN